MTISDFVADLRAATPSNAAELAVPDQDALRQALDSSTTAMANALQRQLKACKQQLSLLAASPTLQNPDGYILQRKKTLEFLFERLSAVQNQALNKHRQRFLTNAAKLDALSPLKVLTRGYAMVQTEEGSVVRSVGQISENQNINITLNDGSVNATITHVEEKVL